MRYIDKFSTSGDVTTALVNGTLLKPYVAYVEASESLDWNTKEPPHDYSKDYFTIQALEDGTIVWHNYYNYIYYRKNGGEWLMGATRDEQKNISIPVVSGDVVEIKGNAERTNYFSATTCMVNIYGNINSIRLQDSFSGDTTSQPIRDIFSRNTKIVSAENLVLPATQATDKYFRMFYGCTSLTTAPVLPATTLTTQCYKEMFQGCTSLTAAPELPATILTTNCYNNMFNGCSSLNYIKCLASVKINTNGSTSNWVYSVASSGTFVKKAGVTWPTGTSGIPNNWTVVEV